MNKKTKITPEEIQEFRDAMRDVTRIKKDTRIQKQSSHKTKVNPKRIRKSIPFVEPPLLQRDLPKLSGADSMHFARDGIQHKRFRKLRQGKIPIEATLDLHRMTTPEAYTSTLYFIDECIKQHIRWVCIIHGKGYHSNENPVIKNALNQWLRENENVLAFHTAKPKHGGTGAVYVLLKSHS